MLSFQVFCVCVFAFWWTQTSAQSCSVQPYELGDDLTPLNATSWYLYPNYEQDGDFEKIPEFCVNITLGGNSLSFNMTNFTNGTCDTSQSVLHVYTTENVITGTGSFGAGSVRSCLVRVA